MRWQTCVSEFTFKVLATEREQRDYTLATGTGARTGADDGEWTWAAAAGGLAIGRTVAEGRRFQRDTWNPLMSAIMRASGVMVS
jgi:hypothetical protein